MKIPPLRTILSNLVFALVSLVIAGFAGEVLLRTLPIQGIELNVSRFDPITGVGYYPGSTLSYRTHEGATINRAINSLGYPDREPDARSLNIDAKPHRVGFFGDSYTEARQVPLQDTFFRRIESKFSRDEVEAMAFGVSGFGTHQSFLTYMRWAERFKFDLVIYVFVENDLGDQIREIKRSPNIPYPLLDSGNLKFDKSFLDQNQKRQSLVFKIGDFLTARSLLFATASNRVKLLLKHGVSVSLNEEERLMATATKDREDPRYVPNENDVPSSWPAELRERAKLLAESVILEWAREVGNHSSEFAILYIPRESEFQKPAQRQDSWKLWLSGFCSENNIAMIDPSPELIAIQMKDVRVYRDHFTERGHEATARALTAWLNQKLDKQ